jgi:hypothetical protein
LLDKTHLLLPREINFRIVHHLLEKN